MSDLELKSPITAIGFSRHINISASGGTAPYVYSLKQNGVGGSITLLEDGSATYFAPTHLPSSGICVEEIKVEDAENHKASTNIIVGDYVTIFCDVIAHELNLSGRVFIANQKFEWPKDDGLFVVVEVGDPKLIGNNVEYYTINNVYSEVATVNSCATISVNAYSRGLAAMQRFPEILMAFASTYGQQQQSRNGIRIATSPSGPRVHNLSELDGNAMLYRYQMDVSVFHNDIKIKEVDYFNSFQLATKVD